VLAASGTAWVDSTSSVTLVRVTDWRDGDDVAVPNENGSSFNNDASRFIVNIDGQAVLFGLGADGREINRLDTILYAASAQSDSCQWSAADRNLLFALSSGIGAPRILGYDIESRSLASVKDFSGWLPEGETRGLSKSRGTDDRFAFAWRPGGDSAWRSVVVWDQKADGVFVFDIAATGGSGFRGARLDRSGEALIVEADSTRVWRYRSQTPDEAVTLESPLTDLSRTIEVNVVAQVEARISGAGTDPIDLPRGNTSRDGRFAIFNSFDSAGRRDVFLALNFAPQSEDAAAVEWTNLVNCQAEANRLRKSGGGSNSDDASATSLQIVEQGDTFLEFSAPDAREERWCGLNQTDRIHRSTSDINFAFRLAGKKLMVVEDGKVKSKTKYKAGQTLRIAVESGVVNYYRNGSVFYTSTLTPVYPLIVNASLVTANASIENVAIAAARVRPFVSIDPTKVTLSTGESTKFSAIVTGGPGSVVWSCSGGTITSDGTYTAPNQTGSFRVTAASDLNPNSKANATATVIQTADNTPPVISSIASSGVTSSGASITWSTNEGSDSTVQYGTTTTYDSSAANPAMVTAHALSLSNLSPGTVYHYRVRSKDAAGNSATSSDRTFTTVAAADTTAPVISAVAASTTSSSATVTWTTNEASTTQVEYGTTMSYGSSTSLVSTPVTAHSATLSGLSAGTLYHYRVKSRDAAGNVATSANFTLTTGSSAPPPPPPSGGGSVKTDYGVYSEPAPPALPAAGGTFVDPTFGSTIMRVTDQNDGAFNGTNYSYWPNFNRNSTRLYIIAGGSPTLYTFDPVNFRISNKRALYINRPPVGASPNAEDSTWSGLDPDVMYGHDGLRIWAYNVVSNSYTLVKDLAGQLPAGYVWQMSKSTDDNVFAFTVKNTAGTTTGYCAWRRNTDSLLYTTTSSELDEVQVDKSGQWLVVKTGSAGAGQVRVKIVNIQTRAVENLVDGTPDYAPGHSDNGNGFVLGGDNWINRFTYRRLSSPHTLFSCIDFGNDWSVGSHVSMAQDDDAWMLMSTFVANTLPSTRVFRNELFLFATDGSKQVRRFAHTHSVYREYWDTPRATISRDGRFAVFTSNWGSTSRRDVFVVRIPGTGSAPPPPPPPAGDTTAPTISSVGSAGVTTSGVTINWSTNEASDTQVEYGATTGYGSSTPVNTAMVTGHSVALSGLSAATLYHYRVKSRDAAGNLASSSDFTFTTASTGGGGGGGGGTTGRLSVVWTNLVNTVANGSSLQKIGGFTDTPDAGARGQVVLSSGDGYLEFTATETNKTRFCGLTRAVSGTDYTAIDFSLKLTGSGVVEVRENNAYKAESGYSTGDVFKIAVEGGQVKYYRNGSVFYTSTRTPSYPLIVDASLIGIGATVTNAMIGTTGSGLLASAEPDLMRAADQLLLAAITDWRRRAVAVPALTTGQPMRRRRGSPARGA
jgi:hypothetical protein